MGKMAAISQVHAHYCIPRSQQGKEHCHIRLSTGMRLHVGITGTKQLLGTVNGQLLHHIHMLAATIITLARITLGILVGQHAALGSHYCRADNILRSNQLQFVALAVQLRINGCCHLRIYGFQIIHQSHLNKSS